MIIKTCVSFCFLFFKKQHRYWHKFIDNFIVLFSENFVESVKNQHSKLATGNRKMRMATVTGKEDPRLTIDFAVVKETQVQLVQ